MTAGDLVSVVADDGLFGVVKILMVDDGGVHIRLYAERFEARPDMVDPAALTLRPFLPPAEGPFSLGHIPLSHQSFAAWQPVLISTGGTVESRELAGYRDWLDAEGGYF